MTSKTGPAANTIAALGEQLYVNGAAVLAALKNNEYFVGLNVASLVSYDEQNLGVKMELVMRDPLGRQLVHVAGYDEPTVIRDFQRACMDYNDLKLKAAEQHR